MANPAETAYSSFRDQELSNDIPLVEFRPRKVVVHTFLRVVPGHCLRPGFMESRNFFVLCPIRMKFYIRTWLIESFPTTYWSRCCAEEKLHFTPVHTLRQLKRDAGRFPPLLIGLADRNGLKNLPRQIFSGCVKFGGNTCRNVDTLRFDTHIQTHTHTHTDTHTHTHTNTLTHTHTHTYRQRQRKRERQPDRERERQPDKETGTLRY